MYEIGEKVEYLYQDIEIRENPYEKMNPDERIDLTLEVLCKWYEENKRDLPWRHEITPYRVWISEIMLQQTRVEAVKPYFYRFMEIIPSIRELAYVEDVVLLKLWEGLGYYSRAKNLKKAAQICVEQHGGELPSSYEELLKLPGIGSYTAGAIASIAFSEKKPAVDGNVLRVMHRVLLCQDDILQAKVKKTLEIALEASMKRTDVIPGICNQALMELGACICIPNGQPICKDCPMRGWCLAKKENMIDKIPVKAAKKARKIEEKSVFLITDGNSFVLGKRPDKGLLAGLYELPSISGWLKPEEVLQQWQTLFEEQVEIAEIKEGKHIFSHVEWHMKAWKVTTKKRLEAYRVQLERCGYEIADKEAIREQYAIPSAFQTWKRYWDERNV